MIRPFLPALFSILIIIPTVQSADNAEHRELLSKHYRLEKPDGAGPFPAVMLVSGFSGFDVKFAKGHYDDVQSRLVGLGFVTLRVNYLAARNVSSCWPDVPLEDVASDISIAVEYLRQQPFVKKGAMNIIGWSYGGGSALKALGKAENRELVQVDSIVVYYTYCRFDQVWESEVPILVLHGAIDDLAPLSNCEALFRSLPKRDKVTVRVYDDAHHAFDMFELPAEMQYRFGTLGYNEAAAKSAWIEVTNFLRK